MRRPAKSLIVDVIWVLAAMVFACVLVAVSVHALDMKRGNVDALRVSLRSKEVRVFSEHDAVSERAALDASLGQLGAAQSMVTSDARRGAALSKAARDAGVSLVLIKSGSERVPTDAGVISRRHELSVVGDYRQLATFFDALYKAEGIVGIDSVEIESDGSGQQTASLEVAWFSRQLAAPEAVQ